MIDNVSDYLKKSSEKVDEEGLAGLTAAIWARTAGRTQAGFGQLSGKYLLRQHDVTVNLAPVRLPLLQKYAYKTGRIAYESEEVDAITLHLPRDVPVIEFGSGTGFVSVIIAQTLDNDTPVCVEPNPAMIPVLQDTAARNHVELDIVHGGYHPNNKTLTFSQGADFRSRQFGAADSTQSGIPGYSLTRLCSEFGLDRVTIVSDMEGGETQLITEEWEILREYCETLIVEFHDKHPSNKKERLEESFSLIDRYGDVEIWKQ